MNHAELVEKLRKLNLKNRDIEGRLGMPKNSLSGMLNDEKRMPRKWHEALELFVLSRDIFIPEVHPARFPGMTHKESGDKLLQLLEEVPGLKKASEIICPLKPGIEPEPLSKDEEDELLGKTVRAAAKKHKQDPYEFVAWAEENFGKKPEPKLKDIKTVEKQAVQAGETYLQKRQREKNGIKND